jgi:alkylation response protein AidB-like acyl-CoA dehydrogenase
VSESQWAALLDLPGVERRAAVEVASSFALRELTTRSFALDAADEEALDACWALASEIGLHRALLPETLGGAELELDAFLACLEEVAFGDAGVALLILLCNAAFELLPAELMAGIPPRARWALVLPQGRPSGEALQLSPGDEHRAGGARLRGRLRGALGAFGADGFVIALAGAEPVALAGAEPVALAASADGLEIVRDDAQMGMRAARAAELNFAQAPVRRLLAGAGADGDGHRDGAVDSDGAGAGWAGAVEQTRALVHLGTAAIARGVARRAHAIAFAYAHDRRQGGAPIIEHGLIVDMLGGMAARLGRAPSAGSLSGGSPNGRAARSPAEALAIKIAASEAALESAIDSVQVFGGAGYVREAGAEKLMRDAKYCALFPTANWLARDELVRRARVG